MHDRQLDGQTLVFGNEGALYKTAMTWFDHTTGSIWSQPIGTSLAGELKGKALKQIPSTLDTWDVFRTAHPDGRVLTTDLNRLRFSVEKPRPDWVIGVVLDGESTAVYFPFALDREVLNTTVGMEPVLIWADPESGTVRSFLRRSGGETLTFELADGGRIRDRESGSEWDPRNGLALAGQRSGENLSPVPWTSSFDWAWRDFYPQATFIGG